MRSYPWGFRRQVLYLLAVLILVSVSAAEKNPSRASAYVPLDSWVYPTFERLAALNVTNSQFTSSRPWTRLECARLLTEIPDEIDRAERVESEQIALLRAALEDEFANEVSLLAAQTGELAAVARGERIQVGDSYVRIIGISGSPLTDGYHFGETISNDFGRPSREGINYVMGYNFAASAGAVAFASRGEYQYAPSAPGLPLSAREFISQADKTPLSSATTIDRTSRFELLDTYLALNIRGIQFSVGKQSIWWGQGRSGSLMFSNNAPPLRMVRIDQTNPIVLPFVFRYLGPVKAEFFLGQVEGHRYINTQFGKPVSPQPFLHGQRFSFKPTSNMEISVNRTVLMGGPGLPFTFESFWRSMFTRTNAFGSDDPGDRRSGVDFSYRLPRMRNRATFYFDAYAEDEISPIGYPHRSAFNAGLYFPLLPKLKPIDFRLEGYFTDLPAGTLFSGFHYFNVRYLDGYTNSGKLIGHVVGRQGTGVQLWSTYWRGTGTKIQVNYRNHTASSDFVPGGGKLAAYAVVGEHQLSADVRLSAGVQLEDWRFPVLSLEKQRNVSITFQVNYSTLKTLKKRKSAVQR